MPIPSYPAQVGRRLRDAREHRGVNIWQAAAVAQCGELTYLRHEYGRATLRGSQVLALAAVVGVRAAWLLGADEVPDAVVATACGPMGGETADPELDDIIDRLEKYVAVAKATAALAKFDEQ